MTSSSQPETPDERPLKIRGSVLSSKWAKGLPIDKLTVTGEQIVFMPAFRRQYLLDRRDIEHVEVERIRLPFVRKTAFTFVVNSDRQPPVFVTFNVSRLVSILRSAGWPVLWRTPTGLSGESS